MTPAEHAFHVPKFKTARTSSAICFHLHVVDRKRHMGWALCTVNEDTGELTVCSDWGNWTYLWGRAGMPQSSYSWNQREGLLEFIGDRSDDGCDYLAMKLTSDGRSRGDDDARSFDSHKTCVKFKKLLCEKRLEFERDPHLYSHRARGSGYPYYERDPLTADLARELWDALSGELADTSDHQLWCERFMEIDNSSWITSEPWEHTVHEPTTAFYVLRDGILPALRDAAMAVVRARRPAPPSIGWAGDLALRDLGPASATVHIAWSAAL